MICQSCGAKMGDNEKFCRFCGTPAAQHTYQAPVSQTPSYQVSQQAYQAPRQPYQAPQQAYQSAPQQAYQAPQQAYQSAPQQAYQAPQQAYQSAPQQAYQAPQQAYQAPQQPKPQQAQQPWAAPAQAESHGGKYAAKGQQAAKAPKAPKVPKAPKAPGKKPGKGILIGGIAAAVVLVAILVVVLVLTGSPTAKVTAAFAATGKELSAMSKAMKLEDNSALLTGDAVSQDLDIRILSLSEDMGSEAAMLEGAGVSLQMDVDLTQRNMAYQLTPYLGSAELLDLILAIQDDTVTFGLPQLLPDNYGISTVTMMDDLTAMGAQVGELSAVSFNFYDLVEMVRERTEAAKPDSAAISAAAAELVKALEVEKDGSGSVRVNGHSVKATTYIVTVPQDSLEAFVEAMEDALGSGLDYAELMRDLFEAMHLPASVVDELMYEMGLDYYTMDMDLGTLYDFLDELGDLKLEVSVADGKVAAIEASPKIYGEKVKFGIYLGGGEEYADDLSIKLDMAGGKLTVESTGDHTAKDGVFTDETVLTMATDYSTETITMVTEYDPEAGGDNLFWRLVLPDGETMELEGRVISDKKGVEISIGRLRLEEDGQELMSFSLEYKIMPYQERIEVLSPRMLSDMTQQDLMDIVSQVEENAMTWAYGLVAQFPDLMYMF